MFLVKYSYKSEKKPLSFFFTYPPFKEKINQLPMTWLTDLVSQKESAWGSFGGGDVVYQAINHIFPPASQTWVYSLISRNFKKTNTRRMKHSCAIDPAKHKLCTCFSPVWIRCDSSMNNFRCFFKKGMRNKQTVSFSFLWRETEEPVIFLADIDSVLPKFGHHTVPHEIVTGRQ